MADAVVEDEGVGVKGEKVFGVVVADLKQRGSSRLRVDSSRTERAT